MVDAFIIRAPQSPGEWKEVKRLLWAYRREFDDDTCFTSFEVEMEDIEKLYAEPDKVKLIAYDASTHHVVGCVALRALPSGKCEMKRLYVEPAYRGYHLGRDLAEAIIRVAKAKGYGYMVLDTMLEMQFAQALYKKLGFHVVPPYNQQDPAKVICFEKRLI